LKELKNIKESIVSKAKKVKVLVNELDLKNRIKTLATIAAVWSL
jgi:hypothetical protein